MNKHLLQKRISPLFFLIVLLMTQNSLAGPKIVHWTTDNGLRVYYVSAPTLPMVDLRLVFAAGSVHEGQQGGLAKLTAYMLDEGADGLSTDQIAEQFDSVGAQYGAGASKDTSWVTLRTLTFQREQDVALKMWLKLLNKADFPEKSLQRLKNQTLIGLKAEQQSPASIASKAFYKHLYPDHPYGKPSNGTEESVTAIKREDLQTYFKRYFVANNGVLAIVGALDRSQAEALAKRISAVLSTGKKAAEIPPVKALTQAKTIRIPFPSKQAHIYIGQPGNRRGDPDYFTLYAGNHVLGGSGFNSRLVKEVRVARGLSYSVYSYFLPLDQLGPFMIGMQTKTDQSQQAIEVTRDVLQTFIEKGPSDEELQRSKKNISGGFPLRTASNAKIVSYLTTIGFYGLPLNYLDTFTTTINQINKASIVEAFQRRLQMDKMVTIIVGGEAKAEVKMETPKETVVGTKTEMDHQIKSNNESSSQKKQSSHPAQ